MLDDGCGVEGCDDTPSPASGIDKEHHKKLPALQEEAELLSTLFEYSVITDTEAGACLMEFAALISDDEKEFLSDLGIVVGGRILRIFLRP